MSLKNSLPEQLKEVNSYNIERKDTRSLKVSTLQPMMQTDLQKD